MAIIVEHMNMPRTCTMCWISNICQEHIHDLNHIGYDKRLDDCPLLELVRCEDCKWYKSIYSWNGKEHKVCVRDSSEPPREQNDYCSYGERRTDE